MLLILIFPMVSHASVVLRAQTRKTVSQLPLHLITIIHKRQMLFIVLISGQWLLCKHTLRTWETWWTWPKLNRNIELQILVNFKDTNIVLLYWKREFIYKQIYDNIQTDRSGFYGNMLTIKVSVIIDPCLQNKGTLACILTSISSLLFTLYEQTYVYSNSKA